MSKKFFPVILMTIALMTIGCEKKVASELDLDAIPDKVMVEGYVKYAPCDKNGVAGDVLLADNVVVNLDMSLKELSTDTLAYKRYSTVTDADGHYSFELPAVPNKSVSFTLSTSFEADTYGYDSANSKWVAATGLFQQTLNDKSVFCGQKTVINLMAAIKGIVDQPNLAITKD
ncbi:MAG: hypothetical protein ACI30B_00925 [Paludibacteraceae bacterium]